MIVKPHPARELLLKAKRELDLDHVQVSDAAVFRFAQALNAEGLALAKSMFAAFREDNEMHRRLRLANLKKLTDEHVEEALNGED